MLNIIKSLLFRLKKAKVFWALLIVCALLPLVSALLQWILLDVAGDLIGVPVTEMGMSFLVHTTLSSLASISSDVGLFALICTSVFLCREFTDGTIRNVLLSNKKRSAVYFAYLIVGLIIALTYTLAYFLVTTLALGIPFGFGADALVCEVITACLCSLLLGVLAMVFVVSCVLMFMFATGKQSSSIAFPLLITIFLPGLLASFINILVEVLSMTGEVVSFDSWIPLYNATLFNSANVDGGLVAKISLYYLLFSALFVFLGNLASCKKDLK